MPATCGDAIDVPDNDRIAVDEVRPLPTRRGLDRVERRDGAGHGVAAVELAFDVTRATDGAAVFARRYQRETALSGAGMDGVAAALGGAARDLVAKLSGVQVGEDAAADAVRKVSAHG